MLKAEEKIIHKNTIVEKKKERIWYIDLLKIFSMVAVIILHVNAMQWPEVINFSFDWKVSNMVYILTKWSVPVFIMCSGMMFLDSKKEISLKKMYKKYILRLFMLLLIWSTVYFLFRGIVLGNPISIKTFLQMHQMRNH